MYSDHATITGTHYSNIAHTSEDYAFSADASDYSWAAVSDGCSGATGRSDLGARVMVLAVQALIEQYGPEVINSGGFKKMFYAACVPWYALMKTDDMFATLAVVAGDCNAVYATVMGDGAVLFKYADGRVGLIEVSYPENAPDYPIYHIAPELHERWKTAYPAPKQLVRIVYSAAGELIEKSALDGDVWRFFPAVEKIVCVAVASDGIGSRREKSSIETVREILDFKSTSGAFLQRRLGSVARRSWRESRTEPFGDLSVAAIWFGVHHA